ncbi:MAG: MinD/ParA family protein [Deltaproteobacteria bacterium]|nr:MinD/ParA family protein [Deltaproteobacteria bacterium]
MARIITITSGKGGVGKTGISLNLSLSLASEGYKVCLFDADLGLANVNILTGIYPKKDLESVISGQFGLNEIIIKDFQGIDIIPGSSGVEKIADLTRTQTGTLISAFLDIKDYDYFIFDTSAGISSQVLSFCMASHEIILVATCEPTSLTDAYSMLKVLSKYQYKNPVKVVINQVKQGKAAQKAYAKLKDTVKRFLCINVEPLGIVAWDKNVRAAVISQTPFFMLFPDTIASKCIKAITQKLINRADSTGDMPLEIFWDKCLSFFEKHYKIKKDPVLQKAPLKEKDPDTLKALSNIESKLSMLIKEVGAIKQFIEIHEFAAKKSRNKKNQAPGPKEIALDFESWLKKGY